MLCTVKVPDLDLFVSGFGLFGLLIRNDSNILGRFTNFV